MSSLKLLRHPRKFIRKALGFSEKGDIERDADLSRRKYKSYDAYVRHQQSKLDTLLKTNPEFLQSNSEAMARHIGEIIGKSELHKIISQYKTCVCLGARSGGEVLGFMRLGIFAVGVDLNPGKENPLVMQGDFHNLIFPDALCDLVYTNSLDHCFDLDRVIREINRILRPDGVALIELENSSDSGGKTLGPWESFGYETTEAVALRFAANGFEQVSFAKVTSRICYALKKQA